MIEILESQLRRAFKDAPAGRFNLVDPHDAANELLPSEIIPGSLIPGLPASTNNTKELDWWFVMAGIPLQEEAIRFFQKLAAEPDQSKWSEIKFLSNETDPKNIDNDKLVALASVFAAQVNVATPLNRPMAFRESPLSRFITALMGWNVYQARRIGAQFGPALADPRFSGSVLRAMAFLAFTASVYVIAGIGGGWLQEYQNRLLNWVLFHKTRAFRLPNESEKPSEIVQSTAAMAVSAIPFVGTTISQWLTSSQPGRGGVGFMAFGQNRINDLGNWVVGVLKTGDPTYRLPQLIGAVVPVSQIVLNRIPQFAGTVELNNSVRSLQRGGDPEIVRRSQGSMGSGATPLTPYGEKIVNAIMTGDMPAAIRLKAEAVAKAVELGLPDPERSVTQMIESRNPITRAFRAKPTDAQLASAFGNLPQGEAENTRKALDTFSAGAKALGASGNLTQEQADDARKSKTGFSAGSGGSTKAQGYVAGPAYTAPAGEPGGAAGGPAGLAQRFGGRMVRLGGGGIRGGIRAGRRVGRSVAKLGSGLKIRIGRLRLGRGRSARSAPRQPRRVRLGR